MYDESARDVVGCALCIGVCIHEKDLNAHDCPVMEIFDGDGVFSWPAMLDPRVLGGEKGGDRPGFSSYEIGYF